MQRKIPGNNHVAFFGMSNAKTPIINEAIVILIRGKIWNLALVNLNTK